MCLLITKVPRCQLIAAIGNPHLEAWNLDTVSTGRQCPKKVLSCFEKWKMWTIGSISSKFRFPYTKGEGNWNFSLTVTYLQLKRELYQKHLHFTVHKKYQFSSHSSKHLYGIVILSIQFQSKCYHENGWQSCQCSKSLIHNLKTNTDTKSNILCQHLLWLAVILSWLTLRLFFSDQQRKHPDICHCGYLPTVILLIIPVRGPVDTGRNHFSKALWMTVMCVKRVCVCKKRICASLIMCVFV